MTYIQLLRPDKLKLNKITVCVDETYYGYYSWIIEEKKYKSCKIIY